jgi:MFS family permease
MSIQYGGMTAGLYINYFLLGMINIIFSSNMSFLTNQLNTDEAGISFLVSGIGIGKLITLSVSGRLSDRFGRKPLVVTASFLYLVFLIGIPFSPTYQLAFLFAIVGGICNSIMDSGAYPALIEAFPRNTGISTVLTKAFISIGAMILPLIVSYFMNQNIFYGYSFFVLAIIFLINGIFLLTVSFPKSDLIPRKVRNANQSRNHSSAAKWLDGLAIILIGFTSTALFMVVQVWLPTFGNHVIGMKVADSIQLLSYYNVGALFSVLLLAIIINRFINPTLILIIYPSLAFISLCFLLFIQQSVMTLISSFLIGFSTAGIFQLCIAVIVEFFPKNKGTTAAYVSIASSSAFIIIPFITGLITKNIGIEAVFFFDLFVAIASVLLAIYVCYRYKRVFNKKLIYSNVGNAS